MEAMVDMTEIGKRTKIKFDVKLKKMAEFKVRAWLFIRLVNLAAKILKAEIQVDMKEIDDG